MIIDSPVVAVLTLAFRVLRDGAGRSEPAALSAKEGCVPR